MTRRPPRAWSRGGFSLAALLLAISIIAVSLAIVRAAFQRDWSAESSAGPTLRGPEFLTVLVLGCGLLAGVYSGVMAIWSKARWPYVLAGLFAGMFLGAGAAALASIPVWWPVICLSPAVLILLAMWLARP